MGILEHAGVDHRFGSAFAFLGGLKTQDDGSAQLGLALDDHLRGTEQNRNVTVVAACMHFSGIRRGVRHAAFFLDGQCIHVGAQQDRPARPAASQDPHDAGFADSRAHFVPESLEAIGDDGGRSHLFETEFGVHVEIAAECDYFARDVGWNVDRLRHVHSFGRATMRPLSARRRASAARTNGLE
jgi:hypothetical protein